MKRPLLHERFRRPPWFLSKDQYLREGDDTLRERDEKAGAPR